MLRVAVPNKGALSEAAAEILAEAGYRRRSDPKDLTVVDPANNVEFFFLRPKDIAIYVGSGELDLGITGRDLAADADAPTGAARRAWSDVRAGLTFLWHHPVQRPLLISAGLTNMANTAYFAVFVLWMVGDGSRVGLTATQYALVVTVLAVGAVLGSLVAEPLHRRLQDARLLCGAWTANALLLLVPVLVPQPFVIAGAVLLLGATNTIGNVTSQSMRQRMVPRAMLGRVAGAGRTVAFGLMPVGALLGGAVAEHAGLPTLFVGAALLALACTIGVALTVRQRTIDACELPDDAR